MDFICIMLYDLYGFWELFIGLYIGLEVFDVDVDKILNVVSVLMILFIKR